MRGARDVIQPTAAPEPPKPVRRRGKSRIVASLSAVLTILIVLGVLGGAGLVVGGRLMSAPGPLPADKVVQIAKSQSVEEIAELLTREGVISQPGLFTGRVLLQKGLALIGPAGHAGSLQAGEFLFKQQASLSSVIDTLTSGQTVVHSVTIPEGLTSEQIVNRLREAEFLVGDVSDIPPEGTLLPTTLRFERGYHRQRVIERLKREQQAVVKEVWDRRAKDIPVKSPQEMVILASVVERETGRADERPRIAGLFMNRLNQKMRLQSDPTTIYGIMGSRGPLGRPLSKADLEQQTAYNTYVINGLPPGPISNPGRASLEAVANPSRTKDLYFVADGTGGHAFAETLEQHNRNVERWRQIERQAQQPTGATPGSPASAPAFAPVGPALPTGAITPQQRTDAAPFGDNFEFQNKFAAAARTRFPASTTAFAPVSTVVKMPTPTEEAIEAFAPSAPAPARSARSRDSDELVPLDSYPVPASRRANRARTMEPLPPEMMEAAPATQTAELLPQAGIPSAQPLKPGGRPRAFDAVAGTPLDPLNNKSFDLNSAKTVPTLR